MRHELVDVQAREVGWMQRRDFLSAAAAFVAAGGAGAAFAQQRSNIVQLVGDALLNGRPLRQQDVVQSGDSLQTGPGALLVFVVGGTAFHVRQNSQLTVERGDSINTISVLRMVTGAVASVWSRGGNRQIVTPTLTAGIRGTGVYTEVQPQNANRTYFCNCYSQVQLVAAGGGEQALSNAEYHQSFWVEAQPVESRLMRPARAINHTDEELETLARLVGEVPTWQALGRKGVRDGRGYMEERSPSLHPAAPRPGS